MIYFGGFLATCAATVLLYPDLISGLPGFDFATLLGRWLMNEDPSSWPSYSWIGFAEHFFNGTIVFPFIFSQIIRQRVGRHFLVFTEAFSLVVWLFSAFLVTPIVASIGMSGGALDVGSVIGTQLIGYLIYGLVLGIFMRHQFASRVAQLASMESQGPRQNAA